MKKIDINSSLYTYLHMQINYYLGYISPCNIHCSLITLFWISLFKFNMSCNISSWFNLYKVTYSIKDWHFSDSLCDFKETECYGSRTANPLIKTLCIYLFFMSRTKTHFIISLFNYFLTVNISLSLLKSSPVNLYLLFRFL